eukprot:scaffold230_cov71-Cyclotella_meneghiniana.AAC.1
MYQIDSLTRSACMPSIFNQWPITRHRIPPKDQQNRVDAIGRWYRLPVSRTSTTKAHIVLSQHNVMCLGRCCAGKGAIIIGSQY